MRTKHLCVLIYVFFVFLFNPLKKLRYIQFLLFGSSEDHVIWKLRGPCYLEAKRTMLFGSSEDHVIWKPRGPKFSLTKQ